MTFKKRPSIDPKSACALIIQDGLVLAVARKDDPDAWGLPGGKRDPNEEPLAAALRELREETTLNAAPKSAVRLYVGPCPDKGGKETAWQGTPRRPPGEGAVAWKDWDHIVLGPFGDYNARLKRAYDDFERAYLATRRIG